MMPIYIKLFNIILDSGKFPTAWSTGIIRPIHKKKGSFEKPENYKPISLLSCLGKLFTLVINNRLNEYGGWSGGAMVLSKLPVPGRPTIWITVGQGPTALAVGAGGGCLDISTLIYPFSPLSPSLWETARYRLKYCLKGPLNPKQPTNQPNE